MIYWIAGLALLACLGVAAYFVARSPAFWIELVKKLFDMALPSIVDYVKKRNPEDIEAKMRECVRRGGEWDNFNKKCRYK